MGPMGKPRCMQCGTGLKPLCRERIIAIFVYLNSTGYLRSFRIMRSPATIDVLRADIKTLQILLHNQQTTSRHLVDSYIRQIQAHDAYLHAMIQITPVDLLHHRADELDRERTAGHSRGPLHGIPIVIKVSKPIIPISSGTMMPSGWSAVGGQTQSAYVRGGLDPTDTKVGHSSTAGSSSGPAVAVSAGYAPVSIGVETDGSLICPAGRASLYTIKPTIGLVPQDGLVPISKHFDSAGPMAKTVYDLAVVLDAITIKDSSTSFLSSISDSWADISVATLDPTIWKFPDSFVRPNPSATEQTLRDIYAAYERIESEAKKFVANVTLPTIDKFNLDENAYDLRRELTAYLQDLEESEVRSLQDVIKFNKAHAEEELPPHHSKQDFFISSQELELSQDEYDRALRHLRYISRDSGVDYVLEQHGVDVIIGPADSFLTSIAAGGGYPIAGMPLSYLDFNGRPLGLAAITRRGGDGLLIKVLSAWEATFPARRPPVLGE
ncbi:putative glutamyl-tRNA amidotransferase subunit A [Nemania sp. FL0031]|nr:putative glutamyl-tRNA amidotransferase subunit A [Nemania sp. FL0031]